jgi:hypothetical protein
MEELIFCGKAMAFYGQISLIDSEDINSYPQWETGDEISIIGLKGVVVSALIDHQIEISVHKGQHKSDGIFYISGSFVVGKFGLIVGNEVAGTQQNIPWPAGEVNVDVYANAPKGEATQVTFILH